MLTGLCSCSHPRKGTETPRIEAGVSVPKGFECLVFPKAGTLIYRVKECTEAIGELKRAFLTNLQDDPWPWEVYLSPDRQDTRMGYVRFSDVTLIPESDPEPYLAEWRPFLPAFGYTHANWSIRDQGEVKIVTLELTDGKHCRSHRYTYHVQDQKVVQIQADRHTFMDLGYVPADSPVR